MEMMCDYTTTEFYDLKIIFQRKHRCKVKVNALTTLLLTA